MDKKILIGGGIAGVVLILVVVKARATPAHQVALDTSATGQPALLYAPPTISNSGINPDGGGGGGGPLPSVSDTTGLGVGDLNSLLSGMLTNSLNLGTQQIQSGLYASDSNALAGINLGSLGGSASLSHTNNGTTFNVNPTDPNASNKAYVESLYQNVFGRSADPGGEAYWVNAINSGESYDKVAQNFALIKSQSQATTTHAPTPTPQTNIPQKPTYSTTPDQSGRPTPPVLKVY